MRLDSANTGSLLLAHQTSEQFRDDGEDGITGNGDVGPVYRFDGENGKFELVDRSAWDAAEGGVQACDRNQRRTTSFLITGFATQTLEFDGRTIPVEGAAALRIHRAPRSLASAVISADGGASPPLFTTGAASGQHYHQLFSEVDGTPIGGPVRIGVGAGIGGDPVFGCWTEDETLILYVETGNSRFQRICIVPITDPLPQTEDQDNGAP